MPGEWIPLALLGVWRVTHLLHAEAGPGRVIVKLRQAVGDGVVGQAMDCFRCLSLWTALPFALLIGEGWREVALSWLALSGGAILLDAAWRRLDMQDSPAAHYLEDEPESTDVQLWKAAPGRGDDGAAAGLDGAVRGPHGQR